MTGADGSERYVLGIGMRIRVCDGDVILLGPEGGGLQSGQLEAVLTALSTFIRPIQLDEAISSLRCALGARATDFVQALVRENIVIPSSLQDDAPDARLTEVITATLLNQVDELLSRARFDRGAARPILNASLLRAARSLSCVARDVEGAERGLLAARFRYLVEAASPSVRLNIGAGESKVPSWINIDAAENSECRFDVRWPWPVGNGQVEAVYMSHILEHFSSSAANALLREALRVLRKDGVLRVVVPDARKWMSAYSEDNDSFFAAAKKVWPQWPWDRTRLDIVTEYLGTGSAVDISSAHRAAFDCRTLACKLKECGFGWVESSTFMGSRFPNVNIDCFSRLGRCADDPNTFAIFMDAGKGAGRCSDHG